MDKRLHPLLSQETGGITLTAIAAKVYDAWNQENSFKKLEWFLEKLIHNFRFCQIIKWACAKILKATLLFVCSKASDSIHREKMEQILLAYVFFSKKLLQL